jgi:hypothetical protein
MAVSADAKRRTARFLFGWLVAQILMTLGLLAWEVYAIASNGKVALITTVVRDAWYAQEWAFLGVLVLASLGIGYLGGHFFASAEPSASTPSGTRCTCGRSSTLDPSGRCRQCGGVK